MEDNRRRQRPFAGKPYVTSRNWKSGRKRYHPIVDDEQTSRRFKRARDAVVYQHVSFWRLWRLRLMASLMREIKIQSSWWRRNLRSLYWWFMALIRRLRRR